MQIRFKLLLAIATVLLGLSLLCWRGTTTLNNAARTTQQIADSAIFGMNGARIGSGAFAQMKNSLREVRRAATPEQAKQASDRFAGEATQFETSWKQLLDHLVNAQMRAAAETISANVAAWQSEAGSYLLGRGAHTRELIMPDLLDTKSREISNSIDQLVGIIGDDIESTRIAIHRDIESDTRLFVAISLVCTVVVVALMAWVTLSVSAGLSLARAVAGRIRGGDFATAVHNSRRDEFRNLLADLDAMRQGLLDQSQAIANSAEDANRGRDAAEANRDRLRSLSSTFDSTSQALVQDLQKGSDNLRGTAQSLSELTTRTNHCADNVRSVSANTAISIRSASAAAEQLSLSIGEIIENVGLSTRLTAEAVDRARRGNETAQSLAQSAQRVEQVVQLISQIASQTNLLALNATIEAARAGESGRGFAVVASEVKSLAQQTAHATDEISALVGQIQSATNESVAVIQSVGDKIEGLSQVAAKISQAVAGQQRATSEIAQTVHNTAAHMEDVSRNIDAVLAAAGNTQSGVAEVLSSAVGLQEISGALSGRITHFLTDVRAA